MDKQHIIGARITRVRYSEVNDPQGPAHFDGFDTVDAGIHLLMDNGYAWNFRWTDNEFFEMDEGLYERPEFLEQDRVTVRDASDRWAPYLPHRVSALELTHLDEEAGIVERCTLVFDNGARVTFLVAEEMGPGDTLPNSLAYDLGGHLYVFHDERLLRTLEARDRA